MRIEAGANYFVTLTCLLAIGIQPLKQRIKWFLIVGQLSTNPLKSWGSIRRVPRSQESVKAEIKLAQTHGNSNSKKAHLDIQFCGCCNPKS